MKSAVIRATGSHVPEQAVANEELEQFSPEARELIFQKTGVRSRRHAAPGECTSDLAIKAAGTCLDRAGFPADELDAVVVATSSPDRMQPATATKVQHDLGAGSAFAFDINSVCSGSTFGIALADAFLRSGQARNLLLIGSEVYSKITNPKDFSSYPFFGDGAGAVLFTAEENSGRGVLRSCMQSDGGLSDVICVPAGGTMLPFERMTSPRQAYFRMKGVDVFGFAVEKGPEIIRRLLSEAGVAPGDVAGYLCHQANINIIRRIAGTLEVPVERFFVNLHEYGNTAGASVLIVLDEALAAGAVGPGDLVVTVSFGGGLSWGANLIRL
ncbi:MAG TPA: ketoacyl-ACP synthase III [Syntrophales bacterium]|nr:ketoacyl-ACP synthase III [Syntrophales bacterium]